MDGTVGHQSIIIPKELKIDQLFSRKMLSEKCLNETNLWWVENWYCIATEFNFQYTNKIFHRAFTKMNLSNVSKKVPFGIDQPKLY